MRIAFVNPHGNFDAAGSHLTAHPDFGGQLVYVREVALALAALGHEVDILARRIVDPAWPEFASDQDAYPDQPGVRILRFPCGPDRFLPKEELWPHLDEWVDRIAQYYVEAGAWPDLWTGHYADGGLCAALLEARSGAPFVFAGHSMGAAKLDGLLHSGHEGAPLQIARLQELDARFNFGARIEAERVTISRAAAIITSSTLERYGAYGHPAYRDVVDVEDDSRFAQAPPGVNLHTFHPRNRCAREAEILEAIDAALARDISPERRELPSVIAWSRLDAKKNHLALVRAFATVPRLRSKANLVMITRGLDDPLHDLRSATTAEEAVLRPIVGEVERAALWGTVSAFSLAGQDAAAALYRWGVRTGGVFCLPALHEPFGLSLIEAMAVGLPVVATKHGGPREITDHGRAGLLADPCDPAELGARLTLLIGNRREWRTHSKRGRKRVLEHYNWPHTAECYARLAEEVVQGHRRARNPLPIPGFAQRAGPLPRLKAWASAEAPGEGLSGKGLWTSGTPAPEPGVSAARIANL